MVVQLMDPLKPFVWIFPNGRSANTKPCLDTSLSGESMDPLIPFEWI